MSEAETTPTPRTYRTRSAANTTTNTTPTPAPFRGRVRRGGGRGGRGAARGGRGTNAQPSEDPFRLMGDQDPAPPPSSQCPLPSAEVDDSPLTPLPPSTPAPIKLTPSLKPIPLPIVEPTTQPTTPTQYLGPGNLEDLIDALEQSPYVPTPVTAPVPLPPSQNPVLIAPSQNPVSIPPGGLLLQPVVAPPQPAALPRRQVHFEDDIDYKEETDDDGDVVMADIVHERQGPGRPNKGATAILRQANHEVNDLLYGLSGEVNESIEDLRQLAQAFMDGTEAKGNLKFMRIPFHPIVMLFHALSNARALLDDAAERSGRTAASVRKAYFTQYAPTRSGNKFNQFQAMKKTLSTSAGSSTEASKQYGQEVLSETLPAKLEVFNAIQKLDQGKMNMQKRQRRFDNHVDILRGAANTAEKLQIQTIFITIGDSIHNDAGLVAFHESSGATGFFLESFKVDSDGVTGLARIHASKKRALNLQVLGAEQAHSVRQENKHLINTTTATNSQLVPSYPLKLSDGQLEALDRADTGLEHTVIVVYPDPWDPTMSETNQRACDNYLRDYMRKVQLTFDPSAPVTAAPFNTISTTLVMAGRCAENYPNRIRFPGELGTGKPKMKTPTPGVPKTEPKKKGKFNGIRSIGRGERRVFAMELKAGNALSFRKADRKALRDSLEPVFICAPPRLTQPEMEQVHGRGGKSVAQDFKTWPILHGRRFFNNLTVDWEGPEAVLAPHGSPAPPINSPDDDGSELDFEDDEDEDDDIVVEEVSATTKASQAVKAAATQQALTKLAAAKKAQARNLPKPAVTATVAKKAPPPVLPPPSSVLVDLSATKKTPASSLFPAPPSTVLIDLSATKKAPIAPPLPVQASSANVDDPFVSRSGSQPTDSELAAAAKILGFCDPPPRTKANLKAARAAAAASSISSSLTSSSLTSSLSTMPHNLKRSAASPEPKQSGDYAKRMCPGPAPSLMPNVPNTQTPAAATVFTHTFAPTPPPAITAPVIAPSIAPAITPNAITPNAAPVTAPAITTINAPLLMPPSGASLGPPTVPPSSSPAFVATPLLPVVGPSAASGSSFMGLDANTLAMMVRSAYASGNQASISAIMQMVASSGDHNGVMTIVQVLSELQAAAAGTSGNAGNGYRLS